jgi:hypothetical protein
MIIFALVLALLAMPATPIEVTAVQFPARGKANLSLGEKAKRVSSEREQSRKLQLRLRVFGLRRAYALV